MVVWFSWRGDALVETVLLWGDESMTKKKVAMSVDEKVLKIAKQHIPNLSEFFEECLKQYLGLADGIYPTANAKDIIDDIGKSQAKLHILNESCNVQEKMKQIADEKLNRPWRFLWNDYKRRLQINPELMKDALKVLPVDAETLEDILDYAYVNQEHLGLNFTWEIVYTKYQKEEVD